MLLLAMITCFKSIGNQICCVGGSLWFMFDSYALLLNRTLTHHFMSLMVAEHLHAFIIQLTPGSPPPPPSAYRLESLGMRLIIQSVCGVQLVQFALSCVSF